MIGYIDGIFDCISIYVKQLLTDIYLLSTQAPSHMVGHELTL